MTWHVAYLQLLYNYLPQLESYICFNRLIIISYGPESLGMLHICIITIVLLCASIRVLYLSLEKKNTNITKKHSH